MEEGDFPDIPEDALGKVWPLIFGTVCNMQAVPVRSPRKGYLAGGEGVHDFTIEARICQAHYLQCRSVVVDSRDIPNPRYKPAVEAQQYVLDQTTRGYAQSTVTCVSDNTTTVPTEPETITQDTWGADPACVEDRFTYICELDYLLQQQLQYEHSTLTIQGGNKFPQGQIVTLNIDGAKFTGIFSGESFTVAERIHPDYDTTEHILCHAIDTFYSGHYEAIHWNTTWTITPDQQTWYVSPDFFPAEICTAEPTWVNVVIDGAEASQKALDEMPTGNFCWLPAGTEVFLEAEAEVLYIVSLIPGTVNNVSAYRKQQTTGRQLLMTVPTEHYTIYETNYTGYTVIEIGFKLPLSKIDDTWGDDIYVSFTSDIGPNPVDIIAWLLTKYTNLTFDTVSKATVKARLTNYPNNFWVKDKLNIFQLIQDIAYQSRCALYVRDNTVYIVYLAEEPISLRTLTESNIIANTFNIILSDSSDLVTKYTATWKETEAGPVSTDNVDNKLTLKYNITKYGINEETTDYYTQTTFSTILKSATFWLIRLANTWKKVEFDTPLTMLDLDLFDCITLNVAQLSATPIKTIITAIQYNNEENTIHFECLTPIRSGETIPHKFFWPADIAAGNHFPPITDGVAAGAGYPFIVAPPIGHILRGGDMVLDDAVQVVQSAGDQYPSDIGDVFPTVVCKNSIIMDLVEPEPAIVAFDLAKKAYEATRSNWVAPPAGATTNPNTAQPACTECGIDCNAYSNICTWQVTVITMAEIYSSMRCDNIFCHNTFEGEPCTGVTKKCCYTFGSLGSALTFRADLLAEAASGIIPCDDGRVLNTSRIRSVSQPQVHYGKGMAQNPPFGGWVVSKEEELCFHQSTPVGLGEGGSLGSQCECTCVNFGGCGSGHDFGGQWVC